MSNELNSKILKDLEDRVTKIEATILENDEDFQNVVNYVKTKITAEQEWSDFIKALRLRVASGGVLAFLTAISLLIGWGVQHWIRAIING
jgi:hypothetical protein